MLSILPVLITLLTSFGIILFLHYLGKEYLYSYAVLLGALIVMFIPFSVDIFDSPFAFVELFYASLFLMTDIISEIYGEKYAKKVVLYATLGIFITVLFVKLSIHLETSVYDLGNSYMLIISGLFTTTSTILVITAFYVEQRLDILNFSKIKKLSKGRFLWLRNCFSTSVTQSVDVILVYPIFFYPVFGNEVWKLMLAGLVFKILIALMDTPFVYLARMVSSSNMR